MNPSTIESKKQKEGYPHNGQWYPRVTSITDLWPKPALYRWLANQKSFESSEQTKQISADWGKKVHTAIENKLYDRSLDTWEPDILPVMVELEKWLKVNPLEVKETEFRIFNTKERYVGTGDLFINYNDALVVVDIKTSAGIYDSHKAQIAAYARAKLCHNGAILLVDQVQKCRTLKCTAEYRFQKGENGLKQGKRACADHKFDKYTASIKYVPVEGLDEWYLDFLSAKAFYERLNRTFLTEIGYLK